MIAQLEDQMDGAVEMASTTQKRKNSALETDEMCENSDDGSEIVSGYKKLMAKRRKRVQVLLY